MINYTFKHLENVPVEYMSNSQVAKAISLDALIQPIRGIQDRYEMPDLASEVVSRNQEAINLVNGSKSKDELYPRANDFEGDDEDRLDYLHEEMDEAGDEAHDRDWEDVPSFANNTPENRWRDLRGLADSTFDAGELESIVKRKANDQQIGHDPQKVQNGITSWLDVDVVPDEPEPLPEEPEGPVPDPDPVPPADQGREMLILLAGLTVAAYMVTR